MNDFTSSFDIDLCLYAL